MITTIEQALDVVTQTVREDERRPTLSNLLDLQAMASTTIARAPIDAELVQGQLLRAAAEAIRLAVFGDRATAFALPPPWVPCSHGDAATAFARAEWVRAEHWPEGHAIRSNAGVLETEGGACGHLSAYTRELLHDRRDGGSRNLLWRRHPDEEIPF